MIAAAFVAVGAPSAQAAKVSVDFFYDSLEPYGDWMEASDYGYVWHPRGVDRDWRPYTDGNWAYTDAGWTWVSEEPFGWATYHYGRWAEIDSTGWVWIPDATWGPAWVSWRRSKTHVGWAPLPPEARFEARVGIHDWSDSYYDIGPTYYSFVNVRDFGARRLRTVVLPPRENITIINQTTNITNITYANNVVVNNGPDYDVVVRESAQPIRRLKLERRTDIQTGAAARTAKLNAEVSGESLRVVAPEMEAAPAAAAPKKLARKLDRVEVDRGWRNAGNPQQVQEARAKLQAEAKAPEGLPPKPQLRGSDTAEAAPGATKPAAATAATDREMKKPRTEAPGTLPPPDTKQPGATAQQPDAKQPGATVQQPDATAEKPDAKRPGQTAKQPGAKRPPETAQQPDAGRPGEAALEKREERPGVAKKKAGEAELPPPAAEVSPPGSRRGERPEGKRPKTERPGEEALPVAQTPPAERPQAERQPQRPDIQPKVHQDIPERVHPEANRPAAPHPDADTPERRAPERPDRTPERQRPDAAERSPESRPLAAERPAAPKKGPAAPAAEKKGGGPEGEAKKEKKDEPERL